MPAFKRMALAVGALLCLALLGGRAGDPARGFLDRVHKGADGTKSKYVVFVPHDYKGDKEYPLIVFLHGAGERGADGQAQVKVGLGPAVKKREKSFPFIVVFPQAEKGWKPAGPDADRAMEILARVEKNYKVDRKRIYLTGLSMGGAGTWGLAAKYPDRWAAIVPICGRADTATAPKIKDLPCWCFHGDADDRVTVEQSRKMIQALKDAGGSPRYDEYKGVDHNSWDRAYATDKLYTWLLKHKRD